MDPFSWHELVDRSSVLMLNWEDFIVEHPATNKDQKIKELADEICVKMNEFYQLVANTVCSDQEEHEDGHN